MQNVSAYQQKEISAISIIAILITCCFIIGLTGCTRGNYTIIMGSVSFSDQKAVGSYSSFNGYKERIITLEEGEKLSVSAEVKTESGSLEISLLDNDKNVLLSFTGSGEKTFTIPETGSYRIRAAGNKHAGSFILNWDIMS